MKFGKKWFALYLFLLLLAVAIMAMLWLHVRGNTVPVRDYAEIKQEGVLRIMTEYNPSGYYISGDTIEGFQYELAQAVSRISGLEVQTILETSLPETFQSLNGNGCDVIARNLPVTSEMSRQYLSTEPIVMDKQVLVQRTAEANHGTEPVRSQLDLAGKPIHVLSGSPALLRLRHLAHEIGDSLQVVEEPGYSSEQLVIMVANGEIDYAVCDQQIAQALSRDFPEIDIRTDISFTQLQAWTLRKTSPVLLDSLNSWFRRMKETGEFEKIYKRYYESR